MRRTLSFGAVLVAVAGMLLVPGAAQAQAVGSGSLTIAGDPGDVISAGKSWAYDTAAGDILNVESYYEGRNVNVSVTGNQGDWWNLYLQAPAGEAIRPGTYTGTTAPFNGSGPGLGLSGDGRGCSRPTGSFVVTAAVFGPHGYLQTLHATYEQHCDDATPAARGTLTIDNPPAPAELALGLSTAATGTFNHLNGTADLAGTVSCNTTVPVRLTGTVTQVKRNTIIRGNFVTQIDCTAGAAAPWTAAAIPFRTTPFQRGDLEVVTTAAATDPAYHQDVTQSATITVRLTRG